MKKLLAVALVLCMMVPCAHAEKVEDFIAGYMEVAPLYNCPSISESTLLNANGTYLWRFNSGAMIIVLRDAKMNIEGVCVAGTDESAGDFLAACVCSIVAMDKDEDINKIFQKTLAFYMDWRDKKEDFTGGYVTINKIGVKMLYASNMYQMVIGHTGL